MNRYVSATIALVTVLAGAAYILANISVRTVIVMVFLIVVGILVVRYSAAQEDHIL
jgi:accessory gene regulator protein AgrB